MAYGFRIYNNGNELSMLTLRDDQVVSTNPTIVQYSWQVNPNIQFEEFEIPAKITDYFYNNNLNFVVFGICGDPQLRCIITYAKLVKDIQQKTRPLKIRYGIGCSLADYFQHFSRIERAKKEMYKVYVSFQFIKVN